jgi:hypothetical protein
VSAFGTVDLLAFLTATGRLTADQRATALQTLRVNHSVSIPASYEQLVELATSERWSADLTALQVAQSAFWIDPDAGWMYDSMLKQCSRYNPKALPDWVAAGMLGATRNAPDSERVAICGRFLAGAIASYGQPDSVPPLVDAARAVAGRVAATDPLPACAPRLRDVLVSRLGYREATLTIVTLTGNLSSDDALLLRVPFFVPGSTA